MKVDLNCDLGEAFGNYSFGSDNQIIPLITSANIACGFHAGDQHVMNDTQDFLIYKALAEEIWIYLLQKFMILLFIN